MRRSINEWSSQSTVFVCTLFWRSRSSVWRLLLSLPCLACPLPSLRVSCRPPLCGRRPKTGGQTSPKSLLFLCMTRMTPPPSAPSASHPAATSPVASPRLTCPTCSRPPPRPPPSWPPTLRRPRPPSSRSKALTEPIFWPLLPSAPQRKPPAARPVKTATPRRTPTLSTTRDECAEPQRGWRSRAWTLRLCPAGWRREPAWEWGAARPARCATSEPRSSPRACGWGWSWTRLLVGVHPTLDCEITKTKLLLFYLIFFFSFYQIKLYWTQVGKLHCCSITLQKIEINYTVVSNNYTVIQNAQESVIIQ